MPNPPRFGLGRSIIHLASMLLVLNVLAWFITGMPLTIVPAMACMWCFGILVHVVEPGRHRRLKR